MIDVPHQDQCAFCEYLRGTRPFTVLYRGIRASILITREQRGIGHSLIVTNAHRPTILDLVQDESHEMIDLLVRTSMSISRTFSPSGIAVWQNNGSSANQVIPHVHFHVAGTYPGGGTEYGDVPELAIEETDLIAAKLSRFF